MREVHTRWWPLLLVVIAATIAVTAIRLSDYEDRQAANLHTFFVAALAAVLSLLWLLALSRWPARRRIGSLLFIAATVALFFVGFRFRGVTGDLVPIFEWRWGEATIGAVEPTNDSTASELEIPEGIADFPQFFGPDRDGRLAGPALIRDWQTHPPEQLWRRSVGAAWSGFAVAGRRAVTQEQDDDEELVVCYDVVSGDVLWIHRDPARYFTALAGLGPRATPTIDGSRVFAQGATGILNCLDLANGEVIWQRNILTDNDAPLPEWGVAGSPLLWDNRVVVSAGGPNDRSLVAYNAETGKPLWAGGSDATHWSSPLRATLGGVDQILMFNARTVAAHDPTDGKVLWTYPWKAGHAHVCMPVVCGGDRLLISSGYGTGCQLVKVARGAEGKLAATREWRSLSLKAKFANALTDGSFAYGLDDGTLVCVDLATGRRRWKEGRYGHGQLLSVGDLLLVTTEVGDVVLVEATPDAPRELTRFRAFDAKTWNPPALAGRYLLVRNDQEAACFRLPIEK